MTDNYYTSTFEVDAKELDSNHSRRYLMDVNAVMTEANNGVHISARILSSCQ